MTAHKHKSPLSIFTFLLLSLVFYNGDAQRVYYSEFNDHLQTEEIKVFEYHYVHKPEFKSAEERNYFKDFEFAKNINVNISSNTDGDWTLNEYGEKEWSVALHAKGAKSIGVIFSEFNIPVGARVYVYNKYNKRGAFTYKNNNPNNTLPVQQVYGDSLFVRYIVPDDVEANNLTIGKLIYDYVGIISKTGNYGDSDNCEVNINCEEGKDWQIEKRSVVRLQIGGPNSSTFCTGVIVNNAKKDGKPYILTANHCISDENDAKTTLVVFNYESPGCKGADWPKDQLFYEGYSMGGVIYRASHSKKDVSLVELSKEIPYAYQAYYAGWDRSGERTNLVTTIHHPQGDVKKISKENDSIDIGTYQNNPSSFYENGYWKVNRWDLASTEPGSSGSPLFNKEKQVIGMLTGGAATCKNPVNDYYSRIHTAWVDSDNTQNESSQFSFWLDPESTGIIEIGGFDPYAGFKKTCDTVRSITDENNLLALKYDGSETTGYWAGLNTTGVREYQMKVSDVTKGKISGFYMNVCRGEDSLKQDSVIVIVREGGDTPGEILYKKAIAMHYFVDSSDIYVSADSLIEVGNDFYAGFEVKHKTPPETEKYEPKFGVFVKALEEEEVSNVWVRTKEDWANSKNVGHFNFGFLMDFKPVLCDSDFSQNVHLPKVEKKTVRISREGDEIFFDKELTGKTDLFIYGLDGVLRSKSTVESFNNYARMNIAGLAEGLYIFKCENGAFKASDKFFKIE